MDTGFSHEPVLLNEVLKVLAPERGGIFVDGTLGGGGHSEAILGALSKGSRLFGIDRDPHALAAATNRLSKFENFTALRGNFFEMGELLGGQGVSAVSGILLDLGVSSHQLDTAERGFSYSADAPLDMRMDPDAKLSARDVINSYSEEELARILFTFGEEKFSRRIAKSIVARRSVAPIERTSELVELVKGAIPLPARREGGNPAKRTFQAIRIEVNAELEGLERALRGAATLLGCGGVIAVITFHSLEDRIVKHLFKNLADPCECPKSAPMCICGKEPVVEIITRRPLTAGASEQESNPRSHSAKLRAARKL